MFKSLTLAVIIPAYNEEHHIKQCLEALMRQTRLPDEIIVVDNNCTDRTADIAKAFKSVRVVKESTQGLIAARNRGFNTATSDILCRIDADATLDSNWLELAEKAFMDDTELAGITGVARTRLLPRFSILRTTIYARGYFWAMGGYFGSQILWGANMAIRAEGWREVRDIVCSDDSLVHEDQDLSLCLLSKGGRLHRPKRLFITTEGQVYHYFPKLHEYINRAARTREHHAKYGRWPVKPTLRYGLGIRALRIITSIPPWLIFYTVSFLYWPLDRVMIKRRGTVTDWLESN